MLNAPRFSNNGASNFNACSFLHDFIGINRMIATAPDSAYVNTFFFIFPITVKRFVEGLYRNEYNFARYIQSAIH
jgi:hypothetical protein